MTNYRGKINLLKLKNAGVMDIQGSQETKKCVVIPIQDNYLFNGEKGIYLDFVVREIDPAKRKNDSHIISKSIPKDVYNTMSEEERKSQPILGSIGEWSSSTSTQPTDNVPF